MLASANNNNNNNKNLLLLQQQQHHQPLPSNGFLNQSTATSIPIHLVTTANGLAIYPSPSTSTSSQYSTSQLIQPQAPPTIIINSAAPQTYTLPVISTANSNLKTVFSQQETQNQALEHSDESSHASSNSNTSTAESGDTSSASECESNAEEPMDTSVPILQQSQQHQQSANTNNVLKEANHSNQSPSKVNSAGGQLKIAEKENTKSTPTVESAEQVSQTRYIVYAMFSLKKE